MKNIKTLLALAIFIITFCACSTTNTVENKDKSYNKQMVNDKRIITDSSLDDYAYVAGVNESIVSGNLLKIQVKLINSTSAYRTINYKFDWFNQDGMQTSSSTQSWKTITLEGGQIGYINAVAANPSVRDFQLTLLPDVRD